jgi:uncharacterized protein YkwD
MTRTRLILLVCLMLLQPLAAAGREEAAERQRIESLRKTALGDDPAAALAALAELDAMGEPARKPMLGVVRQLLTKGRGAIVRHSASPREQQKLQELCGKIAELRKAADANLAKLEKNETLQIAHRHYEELRALTIRLNEALRPRANVLQAITMRTRLLELFEKLAPDDEQSAAAGGEAKLRAQAEAFLGMSIDEAMEIKPLGPGGRPAGAVPEALWFYLACRQIESYNRAQAERLMDPEEWKDLVILNEYRESLGRLPLEIDPRLMQSARRHSKEMSDLSYFSHESPTPGLKSPGDRMSAAGYSGGGFGENIASGPRDGERVFWMWFDSPGHHKNMIAPHDCVGIGRWDRYWTQNFGTGRLMLLIEEDRARIEVKGTILPPYSRKK